MQAVSCTHNMEGGAANLWHPVHYCINDLATLQADTGTMLIRHRKWDRLIFTGKGILAQLGCSCLYVLQLCIADSLDRQESQTVPVGSNAFGCWTC